MNNIFLPFFGFLALGAMARAHSPGNQSRRLLLYAGLLFGCLVSIKWNGLGYLLAIQALFFALLLMTVVDRYRPALKNPAPPLEWRFGVMDYLLSLILIPGLVYCLLWIPDLNFNTDYGFVGIHKQILGYHSSVIGDDQHPYCSSWYSWPIMERPISYFFASREIVNAADQSQTLFRAIHLFGNPALYWLSSLAVAGMCGHWLWRTWSWFSGGQRNSDWLPITIILLGFFANFISWATVARCTFLYHYQSASIFAFLALAWYLGAAFTSDNKSLKVTAGGLVVIIITAFIYWLPLALGLEISSEAFYNRMWFRRWI